jgi:hypothetical protein
MRIQSALVALACLGWGCGSDGGRDDDGARPGIPSTGGEGGESGDAGENEDEEDDTGEGDSQGGEDGPAPEVKFDLGGLPDAPGGDMGCTKVDFLFIIDDSGSMGDDQQNLVQNWPTFITGIQDNLTTVDEYQVGIVTSDEYIYNINNGGCTGLSGLVVKTGGDDASNQLCGPYGNGLNFMTELDDLNDTFTCAARVGSDGDNYERPMQALVETVQESLDQPGMCNEGFLRDDSLLVVTIITDEWDGPNDPESAGSIGDPDSWFNDVVAARGGVEENVVVLALINWWGGQCAPDSDFYDGVHIKAFTDMFTYGFAGGICEPDWTGYFAEATDVIQEACAGYVPP